MADCLFCKIRDGVIPSKRITENDHALAFYDIAPQAPTHVLVIPKKHIVSLAEATAEDAPLIGEMHMMAQKIARELGLHNGYRTLFNTGRDGGQQVFHLHLHLLGGRSLTWPPG
jgi:histidine triad (HIT) family protein